MKIEEIKAFTENQISLSLAGNSIENNKLDFKRQWYVFSRNEDVNEFVKDVTAIINSYGGADGFIIIGYDERKKAFIDSPFSQSGLGQDLDLLNIIQRNVDRAFNIQIIDHSFIGTDDTTHRICIIHIPPSLDKPHIVTCYRTDKQVYENEIFIRKGSRTMRPSKSDLDLMYSERNNLVVERKIILSIDLRDITYSQVNRISVKANLIIENVGVRKVLIHTIILFLDLRKYLTTENTAIDLSHAPLYSNFSSNMEMMKIPPGEISRGLVHFDVADHLRTDGYSNVHAVKGFNPKILEEDLRRVEVHLSNNEILYPEYHFLK